MIKTINKPLFNWGNSSNNFRHYLEKEIFEGKIYETLYQVQEGDIVLDLGASIGPFVWDIMDKASKVIAVEPSLPNCELIKLNSKGFPVEIIPKGLTKYNYSILPRNKIYDNINNEQNWGGNIFEKVGEVITFYDIIQTYNLDKIDFIKTDCEGGEYALFTDETMPFLLNNVRNIVGEFHLSNEELKIEFRYFRDKFLKRFSKYTAYSCDGVDITWDLKNGIEDATNNHFINYYNEVILHISNQ